MSGEEWASHWDAGTRLPFLTALSSSDPPAAQVPALCLKEGCPGNQVTAQPQVSHRTFEPSCCPTVAT